MFDKVRLDLRGLEEVAKSPKVRAEIEKLAEQVADSVRSQGHLVDGVPGEYALPVKAYHGTTDDMRVDRAKSRVVLAHASGMAVQAKHGALTKAAAQAGLGVRS